MSVQTPPHSQSSADYHNRETTLHHELRDLPRRGPTDVEECLRDPAQEYCSINCIIPDDLITHSVTRTFRHFRQMLRLESSLTQLHTVHTINNRTTLKANPHEQNPSPLALHHSSKLLSQHLRIYSMQLRINIAQPDPQNTRGHFPVPTTMNHLPTRSR